MLRPYMLTDEKTVGDKAVTKFHKRFPIPFLDTIPHQSVTKAPHPKVRTRAFEVLDGGKVLSHGDTEFFAKTVIGSY